MLKKTGLFVVILSFLALLEPRSSQAQEIKVDGSTATIVTKDGDRITIDGNTFSRDGKNLFHSFKEFGLTQQQIATFLTNPNIHNILTRVTGGNPSYINGLIQVVGGNSNLFLMNPVGVVFGSGASINVPADFSATTATGIGFNNGVFSAVGSNDYSNLTGNPTNFVFNTNQPGSIINAGDLKVSEGSNINLIGGNVINTGSIETPNGKINIQAVAGTSRVKITPEGSLLSLELDIPKDEQGNLLSFTPQDLPTLLTGANNAGVATPNVTIKNNAVGVNGINPQVQVANVNIPEGTGSSIVSGKVSTSSESLGGEIAVLGEKVGVIEGEITANGAQGGGKVLIGGDREGKGTISNAQVTYISPDSKISADATVNGDGGQVIVFAEDYANIHGELTAKGGSVSGDGGFIETSGKKSFNINTVPDTSAENGQAGEWLIDPLNVTIVSGSGDIIDIGTGIFTPPGLPNNTVGVDDLKSGLSFNNTVTVTTQAVGTEEGNITWNSGATLDFDGIGIDKTLVLRADRNIIYRGTIEDTNPDALSPDSLNVIFNSNASGNGGSIDIGVFTNITTGGGNIILGGGSDPLTQPAVATGNLLDPLAPDSGILKRGVSIFGNLSAQGGNISITGQGLLNSSVEQNHGVANFANSSITTTGSGTITLQGTGGSGVAGVSGSSIDNGISTDGIIQAENGDINFVGIGGSGVGNNNHGISLGGTVKTTGSGSLILFGQGNTGNGVMTSTNFNPIITTEGSGDIEIRGSSLDISAFFSGTANTTISTLGTGSVTFNIENEVNLGNSLTPNGSIPINSAQDLTITGSEIIQALGTPITVVGTTTLNSFVLNGGSIEPRDITLTGNNNFNNLVITNGQNVTINDINDINDINLGNLNVTGDFTLTSGGNITANQDLVLNSGNINLTALGNISTPSNNINLTSSGTIDLSANQILTDGGNLTLNAVGNINTPIINTGAIADNGGNVNITSSTGNIQTGNIFTNNSSGSLGDSGSVTLNAIQGSLNVGDIDITNFSLADTPSNAAIDLNALSTINTGAITLGNDNDNTLSSGNVTIETPSVVTVNGNINSNGSDIVIGTATPSEVNINGSVNSNGGDITINSTGLIKIDSGTIEPTSISSGSGNIVLNHGGGDLNPRVPFTVGDANINGTSGSIVTATESIIPTETYPNSFVTPNRTIQINTTDLIDLPIVAATLDIDNDNTGSIVSSSDGLLIDITGGTLSGNGSNLFHSFTRFDLPQSNQTANFVTETSGINNILARIISGEASLINGRIQVSGLSNPNLFLMNPAGIVFGQTATINVPNAFIATTATGIGFGDNWFSANGDYNASLLNVDPINLAFTANTSGAIINTSSLNNTNGSVSLLGGTQINTDNLTNNNTLNLSAIQGQNILDLTTFSVTPASASATLPNEFIPPILTLEELVNTALAKGSGNLGITVLGSNSVQVDSNNTIVNLGDIATQNISANNVNITTTNNVTLGTFGDTIADNSNSLNVNANGQLQLLGTLEPKGGDVSIVGVNNFISPNNINTGGGNFTLSTSNDYSLNIALFTDGGNFTLNSLGDVAINSAITTTGGDIEITGNNISSGDGVVLPLNTANEAGNGGNINLSSLNGNVNVNGLSSESSVGNGGNISINTNLGDINIGNVNSLSGGNLSLTATGNISNTEGLTVGGSTLLSAGNNITLDNSNNDFQSLSIQNGNNVTLADVNDLTLANIDALGNPTLVEISGNLDLRVTGTTNINSNIQANSILTDSSGSTVINGDTITTTLNQTYNDPVILAKDTVITGNNIIFGSSIDSQTTPQSLTINGVSELGSVGSINALSQLTTQQTTLTGNVKTTGNQNYNDAVTLASDVQLDGNNITFGSSIDSQSSETPQSLTINGVSELGNVGSVNALSQLTTQQTTLTGNVKTTGNQNYSDAVTLASDVQLNGNNITFGSSIDGSQSLTVNSIGEGETTFNGEVGSATPLTNLTTNADGTTKLNADVTTSGSQEYNDAVTLNNNITLTTTDSSIDFANTVTGDSKNLTLDTGNGNITFNNSIGDTQSLGDVELNSTGVTTLNTFNANSLKTNEGGTTQLNDNVTTTGSQEYNDAVTLNNNITLTTTDSSIDFANTVNSAMATNNDLTVNTGSKNITFNNSIGDTQSLGDVKLNSTRVTTLNTVNANSLTTNEGGTTQLNDNVTTTGSQEYNDAVTLNNNITLTTTNSSIYFANTVRGVDQNLTANTGSGNITFNSSVGTNELKLGDIVLNSTGTTALNTLNANSLTTDEGGTTQLNGNVTTTGIQNYQNNVEIGNPITLTTTNSNIIFDGTVNSESEETNNLTLRNGTGNIAFNQDVGNTQSLGNIRINTIGNTALNNVKVNTLITNAEGKTILNGNVTTTGVQNYQDNVEIGNSVTLTTTDSNISFQGTVNSILEETNNLLLNTGNANITFNQAIGNTQPLGDIIANSTRITRFNNDVNANSLTTDEGGTTRLNGNVTSSGDQVYNDNVFLEKTIILDTNNLTAVSIEANRTSANPISLTINALDSVTITGKPDANSLLAISTARTNNQETGNITINANNDINLQGAVNTTATSATSLATIAGDISLASENGDVSVLAIASIGTETSGNVIISGNNIDTGVILTFLNPTNVTTGNINIQGNSTTVSGTIQGLSLTTSGTFTLAENPSILALPNRALASLGNATVNTINNQNYNNFNLLNNATLNSIQGEISFTGGVNGNDKNVSITAQNINSENITSQGGNISLTSSNGGITTENLNTSGITGGSIELNSNTTINTADIQTTSSNGNGGDVILNANNDIEVTSINTNSNNGQGGDVNISTLGRLRVTDTIDNTDISINATGTNGGGAITIDFFPDNSQTGKTEDPRLPFVVGNPSSNGTQGIITNGEFSISPDQYFEVVQEGNIDVILLNPQPINPKVKKLGELKKDGDTSNSIVVPPESPPQIATILPSIIPITTISQGQEILTQIEQQIAEKPAFIYVSFTPKGFQPRDLDAEFARREATNTQEYSRVNINKPNLQPTIALKPAEDDQLDLLVITSGGEPIRVTVPVTRQQVVDSALNLSIELSSDRLDDKYKPYAKELYSWLITPIEETLKERKISNLLFILPLNIRFVPIASLYDEKTEKFLVEKYSSGLAPSLNLNDNTYRSVKDLNLLAMGAAEFAEDQQQTPLPGVKLELPTIKTVWNEQSPDNYQEFLNNNFTLETIQANLDKQSYGIIHFGTHGSFGADENEDIFIQLYNSRLNFKDIGSLGLNRSNVELMLLSACQTALGNDIAELGFAGLAVQAGVKSAIGTVWTIGDTGTLAFMTDFYGELKTQTTKAEALRQTQLNMLNGKVRKSEDGNSIITPNRSVSLEGLPEDSRQREDFSHPFYWAPFTLIGNPW